jgi:hypothetical protein
VIMPGKKFISATLLYFIVMGLSLVSPLIIQSQEDNGTGRLNLQSLPVYETVELTPGFNAPHIVSMIVGGAEVDLFRLTGNIQNWTECAGYTTTAPTLKIAWASGDASHTLTLAFESNSSKNDPTLFVHVVDQNDADNFSNFCKDDVNGRLDPMIETTPLPNEAWIYVWLGSYYPAQSISGTFYIFQSPNMAILAAPSPTPAFGSIWSSTVELGGLLIEEYCRDVIPAYPDSRPLRGEDLSWACWVGDNFLEIDLTLVCEWQYGEGSYAVQTGNTFRTYACFRQKDATSSQTTIAAPTPIKVDYSSIRDFVIGRQAIVDTASGQPLPAYRESSLDSSRFAQFPPGIVVELVTGPVFDDGTIWWEVGTPNGVQGWVTAFIEGKIMLMPDVTP